MILQNLIPAKENGERAPKLVEKSDGVNQIWEHNETLRMVSENYTFEDNTRW